jgi:4-oxalomesaconate tautomerase
MQLAIPCALIRGGTSKGLYFNEADLPKDLGVRNKVLLAAMGSPDARQIDGVGGAHPLTSKVAIISPSSRDDADIDYLFLQVLVDKGEVSDSQTCGNILAGVGPFAIESGMVTARDATTDVRIFMVNSGAMAVARVTTPNGIVNYLGEARVDGVPGTAAPIPIDFLNIAGSSCGALLPTGKARDIIDDVAVTCIDNGMPVVILNALDFGLTGAESPKQLETNTNLKKRVERIRIKAGLVMNLGDVTDKTVPKICLVSAPLNGGVINTRTFIPHRVHEAIGVLGSVSVATAAVIQDSVAFEIARTQVQDGINLLEVEHPSGYFSVEMTLEGVALQQVTVKRAALLRTARLLMRGEVFVPAGLQ